MFIGMGMPIPDLANLPGVSRPGKPGGGGSFEYTAINNNFSMQFDGVNDSIIAGTTSLGITSAISVSCWIKTTNTSAAFRSLVAEDTTSGSNRNWNLLLNSGNKIGFIFFNTSGSTNYLVRSTALEVQDGNWHHIVATFDGTSNAGGIKTYVDGGNVETLTALSTGIRSVASVGPRIGSNSNGSWNFTGKLDEVAIWSTALSEETIKAIYDTTANNPGKVADLSETPEGQPTAWYRMGD